MDVLAAMRVFVAIADEGSVTGAAHRLDLSKSVVSRTIQRLEVHLRTRLLNRTTRRLHLTEAGNDYLAHCREMLDRNAAFETRLGHQAQTPAGRLKIGAPVSFGLKQISPLLPRFLALYPEVRIELSLLDRFVDMVEEGVDLAIRIGRHAPDSAIVTSLGETRHLLVAAPSLIAAQGEPREVRDLLDWPLLEYSLRADTHRWRGVQTRPEIVLRSNNGDALLEGALAGLGVVHLPEFFVDSAIERGDLAVLFAEETSECTPINALYPHREFLSRKTRVFLDFLRAALKRGGG